MSNIAISVIIPHYNRPSFLGEALSSIRDQTLQPIEVIVVDDNSGPAARREIQEFQNSARIHYNSSNVGVAEARNIGVKLAKGDWVAFLDDDDLYHPRKLELQSTFLRRHPECEALGGPLERVAPDGETQIWGYREQRKLELRDALLFTASSMCTMLIRKTAFQKVGGMDANFRQMSDLEFGIRLLASGCHMETLPDPLVTYRRGGREQMSMRWGRTCRAHFRIIHAHQRLYRQEFGTFGLMQEYARRAKFYGLRKGRLLGRSLWAVGCLTELMVGRSQAGDTAPSSVSGGILSAWRALLSHADSSRSLRKVP